MIQRIQSVYLLLAVIFPIGILFAPIARFYTEKADEWVTLTALGYQAIQMEHSANLPYGFPYGVLFFTVLAVLLPFYAIFGYKNRRKQMRRVNLVLLVQVLWYATYAAYAIAFAQRTGLTYHFEACALLPLLAIVCTVMAKRGIRKDEALVRAADRIR